jgi:hypothetical protein
VTHPQVGGWRGPESRASLNRHTQRNPLGAGAAQGRRNLRLESLESRQLLSVTPHNESAWEAVDHGHGHDAALPFFLPPQFHLRDEHGGLLTEPASGDPRQIAVSYLRANAPLLGLSQADIDTALVTDQYTDRSNGVTHVYFAQTLDGLRLANANMNINLTADGRVINAGSSFVAGLDRSSTSVRAPSLDARQAVQAAGAAFGLKGTIDVAPLAEGEAFRAREAFVASGISLDRMEPQLMYVPEANGELELAWNVQLRTPDGQHWYDAAVSAADGKLVWAADWGDHASYNVLPAPSESPADLGRVVVVDPHDPEASPFGWHDTNGADGAEFTDTRGNNVSAQEDADANDSGGYRPDGGANLVFDFAFDTAQQPSAYRDAAITNLFYWNNLLHDVHYQYGFDEPSGNFQVNNYGKGGVGNDAVNADAQDGSGLNNANMFTPPDGFNPRMQQFLFDLSSPMRDSSMSNDIIAHEYGHGVSNRLTGGPANSNALDALQSGGMGEGWSDWWSLMFSQDPGDTKFESYPVGTYVLNQPENGVGIRRYPYSFDMTVNPLTLGRYNESPFFVHNTGEIWSSALWDMNWLLIDKYGYDPNIAQGYQGDGSAGNLLALQLVMDGLKLQPANPTLTQARDAILLADTVLTGGANAREIWTAFARRGFGLSADADDGNGANTQFIFEAFDVPIFDLHVTTTTPAENSIINTRPTTFRVDMSQVFDPSTVQAADFRVNGIAASSADLIDANSIDFSFTTSPVTVQGAQTMTMAAGAMLRASDAAESLEFTRSFRYDTLRMEITSTSPANGASVQLPFTTVDVNLNEAVAAGSVEHGDLLLSQGTVTGVQVVDADKVRYTIGGLNAEGTLNYQLAAGAFTDSFGNPSLAYGGSWSLDFATVPFVGAFAPLAPLGGLAYSGSSSGIIGVDGDVDAFTLELAEGQLLAFRATSTPGWQPRITLRNPHGGVSVVAGGAAAGELLIPATLIGESGLYTIEVAAPAGQTGAYTVEALLDVEYESELLPGGPANDTRATAQRLDPLLTSPDDAAKRAMVIGRAPSAGDLPVEVEPNSSNAQANSLMGNFSASSGNVYQMFIEGGQGDSADTDWFNIGMLEAGDVLTISLSGITSGRGTLGDPLLYLYQRSGGVVNYMIGNDDSNGLDSLIYRFTIPADAEYLIEAQDYSFFETGSYDLAVWLENTGPAPLTGATGIGEVEPNNDPQNADDFSSAWRQVVRDSNTSGEIAAGDGGDFYRVTLAAGDLMSVTAQGLNGFVPSVEIYPSRGQSVSDMNLAGWDHAQVYSYRAVAAGTYYVRVGSPYSQVGSYELGVELSSTTPPTAAVITPDYYSIDLTAGQSLSLLAEVLDEQPLELQLQDALGNVLATGAASGISADFAISDFHAPAAGTYYAVVLASRAPRYRLLASLDATIDLELNDTTSTAQLIESRAVDGAQRVLGRIAPAAPEHVAFTELPFQSVDNLTFNHVTYDFKVNGADSLDAFFGSGGPGATKYGDGIGLEGAAAGILTMDFETPTAVLQFGALLATGGTIPNGVVVTLFDAGGTLISTVPLELRDEGFFWAEGLFDYQGAPVARAVLDFNETFAFRFFLDNLKYEFGAGVDLFPVTVNQSGQLVLETETPGDGGGVPGNALDARVRLLDAAGNVLVEDDNSAADGRNARLTYNVPAGAQTYYIEVSPSPLDPQSRGDYLLRVTAPSTVAAPYRVASVSPADGARMRFAPNEIEVHFEGGFLLDSLDADDLKVDGIAANGVTIVDGDTARFTIAGSFAEGTHTITLAAGAVTDLQGTALAAFSSEFFLDLTAPRVVGANVSAGDVIAAGDMTFSFTFAEPMNTANLSYDDVYLLGTYQFFNYYPSNLFWDASGTVLTVQFLGVPEDVVHLTLVSGDGALEDAVGNNLDGEALTFPIPPNQTGDGIEGGDLVINFNTDIASSSVPWFSQFGVLGTQSFYGYGTGVATHAGDVDEFAVMLEAGQNLTLVAAIFGQQPVLSVRDPDGIALGSAVAPAPGSQALLRNVPVQKTGWYTIAYSNANDVSGGYAFEAYLNLDFELERQGGAANDDRASAQDLDPAFIPLESGNGALANVLGNANLPTGVLPYEQEPNDTLETANLAYANFGSVPELYQMSVRGSMTSGRTGADWYRLGAMSFGDVITVNVAGAGSGRGTLGGVYVELYAGSENAPVLVASDLFNSGSGGDALIEQYYVNSPDSFYVKVIYDNFNLGTYDLNVWLQNAGRTPRTDGNVVEEVEPNNTAAEATATTGSWRLVDFASSTAAFATFSDSDHFAYEFQAGDLVSMIIDGSQASADTTLVLRGPSGETIAYNDGFDGGFFQNSSLYGLRIPTTGRYTLEVGSFSEGSYMASVYLTSPVAPPTPELTSDYYRLSLAAGEQIAVHVKSLSGNENTLTIQNADGQTLVANNVMSTNLGAGIVSFVAPTAGTYYLVVSGTSGQDYQLSVARDAGYDLEDNNTRATAQWMPTSGIAIGFAVSGSDEDWYRVALPAGAQFLARTRTPGSGVGAFDNVLDPAMELYGPNGALLASDDNGERGSNARISYQITTAGVYYVRVTGVSGAGEYLLLTSHADAVGPGDTDFDGDVDLDDLNNVRNHFGATGLGDTWPFDGDVDLDDLNAVRNNFGVTPPSITVAPRREPLRPDFASTDVLFGAASRTVNDRSVDALFSLIGGTENLSPRKLKRSFVG